MNHIRCRPARNARFQFDWAEDVVVLEAAPFFAAVPFSLAYGSARPPGDEFDRPIAMIKVGKKVDNKWSRVYRWAGSLKGSHEFNTVLSAHISGTKRHFIGDLRDFGTVE